MEDFFPEITAMLERARNLDQKEIIDQVLQDDTLQAQIVDLNTQEQLYEQGIDSKGQPLGDYSRNTIFGTSKYEGKIAKGQRYDHVTLKDTGEMYASERMVPDGDGGFTLKMNTAIHGKDLADMYGPDIVGLTDESLNEVLPEITERIQDAVVARIQGTDL